MLMIHENEGSDKAGVADDIRTLVPEAGISGKDK